MDDLQDWYSADAATFGDRVAGAREQAGMTQKQLAKRLGVRLATLKSWEDDLSEPRANRLSMMAGLLNVSMMWLINGEGEGLDAPVEEEPLTADMRDLLTEVRDMRSDMLARAEQLGRLEKKLRAAMQAPADV
ncbi:MULTISPECIES: helix-turn-helix domain-containing protein [Roseobacteraceae]|uniref:helix-turn-helix domain-containing protein n=1 Tax=Roseobacteraceae TaxID=2854170 RepID=UPI001C43DF84|nr:MULTISPECIES: helix-turn-helix domain-containing protein [Roseobacteraceae]MBV7408898.1 helix-turn-helix domain-containing protein [Maritimibacter sp. DP1N21-5]MBY5934415.1 helix-turn-helix domain-containing protein [Tateyamaria omphalii]